MVVACVGLALPTSGCDPNDRTYFRQGIGTELYTADTASATELQNIYLDYLCQQSGSYVGANAPSCPQIVPASFWPVIVQAGMNDIDARCDSYLAWLDQKRRENAGILTEIGAVRFAVDSLTNPAVVTGVSPVALAAISAAFGLATGTVNNFNSLLLQVDHTTVQNVVFSNRHVFREDLLKFSSAIDNKPAVIHTLRTYLSICMPMTISANINSTVTVFQQTGSGAGAGPMIPTIGKPFTSGTDTGTPPVRPTGAPTISAFKAIIDNYNPNVHTAPMVEGLARKLCLTAADTTKTATMAAQIKVYQMTLRELLGKPSTKVTGSLTDGQIQSLEDGPKCDATKFKNFFEANAGGIANGDVITLLNKKLSQSDRLAANASEAQIRAAISKLQGNLPGLSLSDPVLRGQMTPDLFKALSAPDQTH